MKTKKKILVLGLFVSILLFSSVISYHIGIGRFSGSLDDQDRYFDATLPCSYLIDANSTHTFCFNGTTHKLDESSSSNRSLPIQNAIDDLTTNGGLIFVKSGNYSDASIEVTNNVVLVLEVGVTGLTYTTTGTGIVLKYASGYAYVDAPLNMTGHQIVHGVFHSGTSFPSNPTEGQPFYRTDEHIFYVYNGTDWEAPEGSIGPQGEQGPAGTGGYGDYTFIIYQNSSNTEFRDWQGQLQASNTNDTQVILWAIGNCSDGDLIFIKSGTYTIDSSITDQDKDGITLLLEKGACLKAGTNLNAPVIYLTYVDHWLISGGEIDGNYANQDGTPNGIKMNGLLLRDANYTKVENMYIHDCRMVGFMVDCWESAVYTGITDCHIEYCGWNGITLGGGGVEVGLYAINNYIEHITDVAISSFANEVIITGNHIRDIDWTEGGEGGGTQWAIGHEYGDSGLIADNAIENCGWGITLSSNSHRNVVANNIVREWDRQDLYVGGIIVCGDYNLITGNNLYATSNHGHGVQVIGGMYNKIDGNHIQCPVQGVRFESNADYNDVTNNWFLCPTAVYMASGCDYTFISANNFDWSTDDISDSGSNTRYGYNLWKDATYDTTPPA